MEIYSLVQPLVHSYGLYAVFIIVMLESAGLPLPGETALILASVRAEMTGDLGVAEVIAAAAVGAIVGDSLGYSVGRRFGLPLLERYGHLIGLDERRIRFGQHMFTQHGGKIVFFGRFVAFLSFSPRFSLGLTDIPGVLSCSTTLRAASFGRQL